jgi:hypothetical protein
MDVAQVLLRNSLPLPFQVRYLARDQLKRTRSHRQFPYLCLMRVALRFRPLNQHLEGMRQQRVPRQDRDPLAEDLMAGRLSAPEIIVIHRRQVIVDERIGVNALDRTGCR